MEFAGLSGAMWNNEGCAYQYAARSQVSLQQLVRFWLPPPMVTREVVDGVGRVLKEDAPRFEAGGAAFPGPE